MENWCKAEPLGCIIYPPLTNKPGQRSAHSLRAVLDQFPLDAERYRARDVTGDGKSETFCNFFTRDVSRAMHCPLPEGKTANQIHAALAANELLYRKISKTEAALCLDLGKFVVAIAPNPSGPGHMTPCREANHGEIYVDHVGRNNTRRIPVNAAFGSLAGKVEYYVGLT